MAEFTWAPDVGASKESTPIVRRAQFGDGYEQGARFGLNPLKEVWTLTFSNRDATEADQIEAFFIDKGGVEAFDWTHPGGVAQRFRCEAWTRAVPVATLYTITATFDRCYEP